MFSYEIDKYLRERNYYLTHDEEYSICRGSIQLDHIKLEQTYENYTDIHWWTNDGYEWVVHVWNK